MLLKGEKQLIKFEYDFAKDGGAISEIAMRNASQNSLNGAKILNAYVVVETELDSAGTPVVSFGINGALTRYIGSSYAALSSGGAGVAQGVDLLLAGDANDVPVMSVGTAALTAGKLALYIEVIA